MEATEYIEELKRMIAATSVKQVYIDTATNAEECVEKVRAWAAEHPRKTRQSMFLMQWPNASMADGVLSIHPCLIDTESKDSLCGEGKCFQCRREFWMQEVE